MHFTIDKDQINEVLSNIQGITGRKTSFIITENVLIRAGENNVSLSATDLETGFEGTYPAIVETSGTAAVNARKLNDIVRMFPSDRIIFQEQENRWIRITPDMAEGLEYHLLGMNPDDYPEIPRLEDIRFFKMNSAALKKMIEKMIVISVGGDEKREHMIGVNFELVSEKKDKMLRMVSTDIKRLSKVDYLFDPKTKLDATQTVIVPKKGLNEVNKFIEFEGDVEIGIKDNHLVVKKENETIILNLLEGEFPTFNDLLTVNPAYDIEFDKDLLLMMMKRMSIVTSDEYRAVILKFANHELEVRAVNPNVGESKENMEVNFDREMFEAGFNPRFFIDALNHIEEEQVLLNIIDNESACSVRGKEDTSYLNIIMPMKF